jgi:hypothetical protein
MAELIKRADTAKIAAAHVEKFSAGNGRLPKDWREMLSVLQSSEETSSLFRQPDVGTDLARVVLLRDITTSDGKKYPWIVVLHIPKFARLDEDYIAYDSGRSIVTNKMPLSEARQLFDASTMKAVLEARSSIH